MLPQLPANKVFTSSELILLQKLYRSRNFRFKINFAQQEKNEYQFLVYGSINTLSSEQRTAFRQHVSKIGVLFPATKVKRALFSSSIAKMIMYYSAFSSLKNAFQGTTYELEITLSDSNSETTDAAIYAKSISCLNYLTKLQFSEDNAFNFMPSLIRAVSTTGQLTPRRFDIHQKLLKSETVASKNRVRVQVINLIKSVSYKII